VNRFWHLGHAALMKCDRFAGIPRGESSATSNTARSTEAPPSFLQVPSFIKAPASPVDPFPTVAAAAAAAVAPLRKPPPSRNSPPPRKPPAQEEVNMVIVLQDPPSDAPPSAHPRLTGGKTQLTDHTRQEAVSAISGASYVPDDQYSDLCTAPAGVQRVHAMRNQFEDASIKDSDGSPCELDHKQSLTQYHANGSESFQKPARLTAQERGPHRAKNGAAVVGETAMRDTSIRSGDSSSASKNIRKLRDKLDSAPYKNSRQKRAAVGGYAAKVQALLSMHPSEPTTVSHAPTGHKQERALENGKHAHAKMCNGHGAFRVFVCASCS
jgi:hypothetical protein